VRAGNASCYVSKRSEGVPSVLKLSLTVDRHHVLLTSPFTHQSRTRREGGSRGRSGLDTILELLAQFPDAAFEHSAAVSQELGLDVEGDCSKQEVPTDVARCRNVEAPVPFGAQLGSLETREGLQAGADSVRFAHDTIR
jgi:hypothetical protein